MGRPLIASPAPLFPAGPPDTVNSVPPTPLSRFGRPALGLGLAFVLASGMAAWWWLGEPRPDRRRVAVAVFTNRTGDSTLEPLGSMAADWVTRGLAQSGLVDVVDVGAVYVQGRSPQGAPTDPHRLALQNGAGTVVSGSYYVATDTLVIRATVEDALAGTVLHAVAPVHAPAGAAVRALDHLREQVIVAVAGVFDARYSAFTGQPSAPSFATYRSFVEGQTAYWQGRPPPEVRGHFDRAAREDSTFLAPAVWLAFVGANGAGCGLTDSVTAALAVRRASLPPFDRLTLELSAAKCRNDWREGFRLATEQAALQPRSAYAVYTAGFFAVTSGHPRAARDLLQTLDPNRDLGWISDPAKAIYWRDYAAAEHLLGDYRSELRHAERQLRAHPERLTMQLFAVRALAGLGRGVEALRRVEAAIRLPDDPIARVQGGMTPGHFAYQAATELWVHGDSAAARGAARQAVEWYNAEPGRRLSAARYERYFLARSLLLLERVDEAVATMAFLPEADSSDVLYLTLRGVLAARQGRAEQAREADRRLAEMNEAGPRPTGEVQRARLKLAMGQRDSAFALLERAAVGGRVVRAMLGNDIHCDPLVDGMRGDERFERVNRGDG